MLLKCKITFRSRRSTSISISSSMSLLLSTNMRLSTYFRIIHHHGNDFVMPWDGSLVSLNSEEKNEHIVEMDPSVGKLFSFEEGDYISLEPLIDNLVTAKDVFLKPASPEDWDIIRMNADYVELNFLKQNKALKTGQKLIFWIYDQIKVYLTVESLNPDVKFAKLDLNTKLIIEPILQPPNLFNANPNTHPDSIFSRIVSFCCIEEQYHCQNMLSFNVMMTQSFAAQHNLKERDWVLISRKFQSDIPEHEDHHSMPSQCHLMVNCPKKFWSNINSVPLNITIINATDFMDCVMVHDHVLRQLAVNNYETVIVEKLDMEDLDTLSPKNIHVESYIIKEDLESNAISCFKSLLMDVQNLHENIIVYDGFFLLNWQTVFILKFNSEKNSKCYQLALESILEHLKTIQFEAHFLKDCHLKNQIHFFWESPLVRLIFKEVINIFYKGQQFPLVQRGKCCCVCGDAYYGKTQLLHQLLYTTHYIEKLRLYVEYFDCKKTILASNPKSTILKLENKIRKCMQMRPSILFIDDIDHLFPSKDEEELLAPNEKALMLQIIDRIKLALYSECCVIMTTISMQSMNNLFYSIIDEQYTIPALTLNEKKNFLVAYSQYNYIRNQVIFDSLLKNISLLNVFHVHDMMKLLKMLQEQKGLGSTDEILKHVLHYKTQLIKKKTWNVPSASMSWEEIQGLDPIKEMIYRLFLQPIKYKSLYSQSPLRLPSGILLYGYPGTGKTFLATALAKMIQKGENLDFIYVKGPELLGKYIGQSEAQVRECFKKAKSSNHDATIIFFDEFDALVPKRGQNSTGVTDRVVNQLLTELDGVESLSEVYILAATNRPDIIDPAVLRPGRIDKHIFLNLPNSTQRFDIIKSLAEVFFVKLSEEVVSEVVKKTENYSHADLNQIFQNAQLLSVNEQLLDLSSCNGQSLKAQKILIKEESLLKVISTSHPSLSQKDRLKFELSFKRFESQSGPIPDQKLMYA